MHLIERFWNHLRNTDGDDIMFALFTGFLLVAFVGVAITLLWVLIEWLGVLVVMVPIVIIALLLLFYGIGYVLINRFDM